VYFALGPCEGSSLIVVVGEGVDMRLELIDGLEGRAIEGLPAEDRELNLDLIKPRCVGRRVVEADGGMSRQPQVAFRFMGRKVVENDMISRSG